MRQAWLDMAEQWAEMARSKTRVQQQQQQQQQRTQPPKDPA
jgi:hypothetical protein